MSKATILNSHWQARTGSFSTHASRKGVNLLGWDAGTVEEMTPEQERDALVAKLKKLQSLPPHERKLHGQELAQLAQRIHELRPKMRCKGIENHVMDVLRERLSKVEWDRLMSEAKRRHAADLRAESGGVA